MALSPSSTGRHWLSALSLLGVVAGCGSTVPATTPASGTLRPLVGSSGLSGPGAAQGSGVAGAPAGTGGASIPTPNAAGFVGSAAAGTDGGAASSTSTSTSHDVGHSGPGVTATSIAIGVAYLRNANAANEAIGGRGIEVSDATTSARSIIAALNRNGGIAGRHVVPLFYGVDPQSSQTYAAEAQAECTYFSQDHKVFAVIDGTQAVGSLARPCLAQQGVVWTSDNTLVTSDVYSNELDPDAIVWSRLFSALVPSLERQRWFTPWNRTTGTPGGTPPKIGIVTADRPPLNRAVDDVLIPMLKRAGYAPNPSDVIRIAPPQGFGDDGATVAAIDNASLKLNSDGVNHVILTDANGSISLLFNNYAYSQHYFPRYGGSSGNFWQTLLTAGDIQPQTLSGALAVGFAPVLDVPFTNGRGPFPNGNRDRCVAIMRAAGLAPTSATVEASQLAACDAFFVLQDALRGVATVNEAVVIARVRALGTSFQPGLALGDRFAADQLDGISAGVDLAYASSCSCFRYDGPIRPFTGPAT